MKKRAVPPWEINKSGVPESGTIASMAAMFIKDCNTIKTTIPTIVYEPKGSGTLVAILSAWNANKIYKIIIVTDPTKPNSSDATAKIESPIGSGKNANFCVLCPKPLPVNPPEPIAINDC